MWHVKILNRCQNYRKVTSWSSSKCLWILKWQNENTFTTITGTENTEHWNKARTFSEKETWFNLKLTFWHLIRVVCFVYGKWSFCDKITGFWSNEKINFWCDFMNTYTSKRQKVKTSSILLMQVLFPTLSLC